MPSAYRFTSAAVVLYRVTTPSVCPKLLFRHTQCLLAQVCSNSPLPHSLFSTPLLLSSHPLPFSPPLLPPYHALLYLCLALLPSLPFLPLSYLSFLPSSLTSHLLPFLLFPNISHLSSAPHYSLCCSRSNTSLLPALLCYSLSPFPHHFVFPGYMSSFLTLSAAPTSILLSTHVRNTCGTVHLLLPRHHCCFPLRSLLCCSHPCAKVLPRFSHGLHHFITTIDL